MAPWTHHRVLRLIFAPCAHCLSEVDAANDRKALSQFDQAGPPLPVSVTPAALPADDPTELHEEILTAHDVSPAAVEVPEEPPLTPAQRAPPPAAAAPLTAGAPPAEEAAKDTDDAQPGKEAAEDTDDAPPAEEAAEDTDVALPAEEATEDTGVAQPAEEAAEDIDVAPPAEEAAKDTDVAPPAEEAAEDTDVVQPAEETAEVTDVETASAGHVDGEEHRPAQPTAATPAQGTEEEAAQEEVGALLYRHLVFSMRWCLLRIGRFAQRMCNTCSSHRCLRCAG